MPGAEPEALTAELAVVIVNWNTRQDLLACLASFYKYCPPAISCEVVVVDNHSSDGSDDAVGSEFPDVTIIANDQNRGFAAANNQAIELVDARYLLLLNPDTLFQEDCLTPLVQVLKDDMEIGMIGCKLLNADHSYQRSADMFPAPLHESSRRFRQHRRALDLRLDTAVRDRTRCEVESVIGAFQLTRTELVRSVGCLDSNLFMYAEDLDLCYRIRRTGKKIIFDASCGVVHLSGRSSRQLWTEAARIAKVRESLFYVHRKHFGTSLAVLALAQRAVLSCARCAAVTATGRPLRVRQEYAADAVGSSRAFFRIPCLLRRRIHFEL